MLESDELRLKKFDIDKIKNNDNIAIIGKRGTGKSFLAKDILFHINISMGQIISPNEISNNFYRNFISNNDISIYDGYDPEIIANFLKKQKRIKKLTEESAFLILNDCLCNDSWKNDKNIREIFMNGKIYRIFYILIMGTPFYILPDLRANLDYIFIFPDDNIENKRKIYEYYAGMFQTFEIFCNMINKLEKHGCLVIDNTIYNGEDRIFLYKAEEHRDFRIEDDIKN